MVGQAANWNETLFIEFEAKLTESDEICSTALCNKIIIRYNIRQMAPLYFKY